ncbi:MAG: RagB/SusD family nutrient uptake outer membrane protein [Gemmatimonas sp.]|nr:RagB/SusD family nutrient uptake outer membrane protein [Gemmatimonas sp.]
MLNRLARGITSGLVFGPVLALTACQDLEVENLVAPDRERATGNPLDVQSFVGGGFFPPFFEGIHDDVQVVSLFPFASAEFTATMDGQDTLLQWEDLVEPRGVHDNGVVLSQGNGPQGPRDFWATATRASSIAYDGLQLLDQGTVILDNEVDVTARARAFAKFMQGWTWGYLGLIFDEAHVLPETIDIPADPDALLDITLESLKPYQEVIESAVTSLEEAVTTAEANPSVVSFPSFNESSLWFGSVDPISNRQFIQMANTLAARLLVLGARTPEERAGVDWNRVAQLTANGLTSDYEMQLTTSRESEFLIWTQSNDPSGVRNARMDYRTIGLADQSGAYQDWIASPIEQRNRFDIVTPDRRITGPTPQSDGAYTRYRSDNNGFVPDRGRYLFSAYQWGRHAIRLGKSGADVGENEGALPLITADENRLLRAEALLRLGDRQGAADVINVTRTRSHVIDGVTYAGLPPVSADGVPTVDGECVPRVDSGACADLLTAIRYERSIELMGLDAIRGYMDSRGWGTVPDGGLLHWPVPGNVLDLYGLPNYTYGGAGNPSTATYAPARMP